MRHQRFLWLLVALSLLASFGGCSESFDDPRATPKQDNAPSRLLRAETVAVEFSMDKPDTPPRSLDKEAIDGLADAFRDAVGDDDPLKWEITGRLHVVIDGEPTTWLLSLHPDYEGRLRVTASEYYRGLDSERLLRILDSAASQ